MGYTHYWNHTRDFTAPEWEKVKSIAAALLDEKRSYGERVPLTDLEGTPNGRPLIDDEVVAFNGRDDYEAMILERTPHEDDRRLHRQHLESERRQGRTSDDEGTISFACCKTGLRPYDVIVVAMLAAVDMATPGVLRISSDGEIPDLQDGVQLARQVLGTLYPDGQFNCSWDPPVVESPW